MFVELNEEAHLDEQILAHEMAIGTSFFQTFF
jgi:hypothetical protein